MDVTPAKAAKIIGVPVNKWAGNCYAIACAFVKFSLVKGQAVYGHWLGPIADDSAFEWKRGPGFCHHGWIEMWGDLICDPTRWAFEAVKPYIFTGLDAQGYYDFGGNKLREQRMPPAPDWNPTEKQFHKFPKIPTVISYIGKPPYSLGQLFWIANLPLQRLGDDAEALYKAIIGVKLAGLIPIDNRRRVLGE